MINYEDYEDFKFGSKDEKRFVKHHKKEKKIKILPDFSTLDKSCAYGVSSLPVAVVTPSHKAVVLDDNSNVPSGIDFRNQLFLISERFVRGGKDDEGFEKPDFTEQYLEFGMAFYMVYIIMPERFIHVGSTLPPLREGQFFFVIPGLLTKDKVNFDNPSKPGSLLYAAAFKMGCPTDELRLAWFNKHPGFWHSKTRRWLSINVVDGKAKGYGEIISFDSVLIY